MQPRLKSNRHPRFAFTLVELVVVIGITAVLTAFGFVLIRWGREGANKTRCINNLRQIYVAMQSFAAEYDGKLPPPLLLPQDFPVGDDAESEGAGSTSFFEILDRYIPTKQDGKASSVWVCPADTRQWEPGVVRCSYGMNPRPLPGFSFRKADRMIAFSPFPFSPAAIQPLSRVIFLADTGGSPDAGYVIMHSAEDELPFNIRLRHETRDGSPNEPYSSAAQMKQSGGKANFLFFDGHVETLGYEQVKEAMWTSQP